MDPTYSRICDRVQALIDSGHQALAKETLKAPRADSATTLHENCEMAKYEAPPRITAPEKEYLGPIVLERLSLHEFRVVDSEAARPPGTRTEALLGIFVLATRVQLWVLVALATHVNRRAGETLATVFAVALRLARSVIAAVVALAMGQLEGARHAAHAYSAKRL